MADLERLLQNLIQFGTITETKIEAGKMLAKVKVDDDRTTDFFPVLSKNNSFTKKASPIRVGEQVVVLSPGGVGNVGVILGSIYNTSNKEPNGLSNKREVITYEDGTTIFYDSESKTLDINAVGLINIVCKEAKVKAETTYIESTSTHKGDVTIDGSLIVKNLITGQNGITISGGSSTGGATFDCDISAKDISSSGTIHDSKGDLTNHSNHGYSRD
jgi:phage baseplate assembly protein V